MEGTLSTTGNVHPHLVADSHSRSFFLKRSTTLAKVSPEKIIENKFIPPLYTNIYIYQIVIDMIKRYFSLYGVLNTFEKRVYPI